MRVKRSILAPVVLTLGSLGVLAGSIAPVVASSSVGVGVVAASTSPSSIGYGA